MRLSKVIWLSDGELLDGNPWASCVGVQSRDFADKTSVRTQQTKSLTCVRRRALMPPSAVTGGTRQLCLLDQLRRCVVRGFAQAGAQLRERTCPHRVSLITTLSLLERRTTLTCFGDLYLV